MTLATFSQRWFRFNAAAWLIGFVLYAPIAHGVTGAHPNGLSPAQVVAHTLAVAVVGVIVASAQRRALTPFVSVPWTRILVVPVVFNIGYWVGGALPIDWDTDILLGFLALGSAVWLGVVPIRGHRWSAAVALLGFPVASVVVELALIGVAVGLLGITPDLQARIVQHSIFWIPVGGGSGILGGWLTGLALSRMLATLAPGNAAQQRFVADASLHTDAMRST
jgi:hypothetical protein